MKARFIHSIDSISAEQWNALTGIDYPFLRHEFLSALELSKSTDKQTGWQPHHCLVEGEQGQLIALMPLYIKHHSYGEYVFDWAWADAYNRNQLQYYPKLLNAIPFTPASGPRWAICREQSDPALILDYLWQTLINETRRLGFSSCHALFPEHAQAPQDKQWLTRTGCQFHWYNHDFAHFDDFLATFSSRKRKNLKKERQQVADMEITFSVKKGSELSPEEWQRFTVFYQTTYLKKNGSSGYLSDKFFPLLASLMGEQIVVIQAIKDQQWIAAALCFEDSQTLYGRYWGCLDEYPNLHFETCYYQGIEYAIKKGIKRFDPGAQGEHKIQRGFQPTSTHSYHYIDHPEFRHAIGNFLETETPQIDNYKKEAAALLPFKKTDN